MGKLLADLEVGEQIMFGRYAVGEEEPHNIIWIKVHRDNTFMAKYIEDFRAFDAKEALNPDELRAGYGNNDYTVSNVRQFLNSTDESWFSPQHEYDAMPTADATYDNTPYENHRGFLNFFTLSEYEAIEYTDVVTAVPQIGKTSIEQKVFLPSFTNLFGGTNGNIEEGQFWDYFNMITRDKTATPTEEAARNTTLSGYTVHHGENWYYWLRSAYCGNSCGVRYVNEGGGYSNCNADRGVIGLRPALRLNPNILIAGESDDGTKILKLPEVKEIEFSSDEVLNLLNI